MSLASINAFAFESSLPACPSSGHKDNCFGTKTYSDGIRYDGEWQNNQPFGQGKVTYPKGEKYVGKNENGIKSGRGEW